MANLTTAQLDALVGAQAADISQEEWDYCNIPKLHRNGYIDDPNLPLPPHFANTEIHPVFQPQNFVQSGTYTPIPKESYAVLIPSLRLATRLSTNVHVSPFFSGMLTRPLEPLDRTDALRKFGPSLRRFKMDARDSQTEIAARSLLVTKELSKMSKFIMWEFGGNDPESIAMARRMPIGMQGYSYGSRIYLDHMFWRVLRKKYQSSDCVRAHQNGFDEDAAYLRTQLYFAITVCHEFCHALNNAIFEDPALKDQGEPYYANDRVPELGFAFEQQILSGVTASIGQHIFNLTFAYGMCIWDFPGGDRYGRLGELGSPRRYGVRDQNAYAVHMAWVAGFFQDDFWDREVAQYGLERLRAVRKLGWAKVINSKLDWDELGLQPLVPEKWDLRD